MMAGMKAVWMLLFAAAAHAQPERAVSESVADFRSVRDYIVRAAEKMPEAEYGFRPVAEVGPWRSRSRTSRMTSTPCARR
jgi:hypothetical protein